MGQKLRKATVLCVGWSTRWMRMSRKKKKRKKNLRITDISVSKRDLYQSKSARVRVAFFSFEQPERMAGSDEGAGPVPYAELIAWNPLPSRAPPVAL